VILMILADCDRDFAKFWARVGEFVSRLCMLFPSTRTEVGVVWCKSIEEVVAARSCAKQFLRFTSNCAEEDAGSRYVKEESAQRKGGLSG
jgi:hypothetical protein